MAVKCGSCDKTVYSAEALDAASRTFHKACFKCHEPKCGMKLTLSNFKAHKGVIYCVKHEPKFTHTQVADTVEMKNIKNAPKKVVEGLGQIQKGTGESPHIDGDAYSIKQAINVPKKKTEGIGAQRGVEGKYTIDNESVAMKTVRETPKKKTEGLGNIRVQENTAPSIGSDAVGIKAATQAPKKTQEFVGVHRGDKSVDEVPKIDGDSMGVKHATSVPRRKSEGLGMAHRGDSNLDDQNGFPKDDIEAEDSIEHVEDVQREPEAEEPQPEPEPEPEQESESAPAEDEDEWKDDE
eukprot:Nk52_evm15s162 gene=Nk52_evmTU15s162